MGSDPLEEGSKEKGCELKIVAKTLILHYLFLVFMPLNDKWIRNKVGHDVDYVNTGEAWSCVCGESDPILHC